MTWTAKVVSKSQGSDFIVVNMEYTDGVKVIGETLRIRNGPLNDFKNLISNKLTTLNDLDTLSTNLAVGNFDPTITPPTPDPADVAFNTWNRKLIKLQQVQKLIDLSILTGNETAVVSLRDDIKATFLPSYINRF